MLVIIAAMQLPLTAQPVYSQLENGDHIDILFHYQGSFNEYYDRYLVESSDGVIRFSYFTAEWSDLTSNWSYDFVGKTVLNQRQIQLLDTELKLYRDTTPIANRQNLDDHWIVERSGRSYSTTETSLVIKYVESEELIGKEFFKNPQFIRMSPAHKTLSTIKQMIVEAEEYKLANQGQ